MRTLTGAALVVGLLGLSSVSEAQTFDVGYYNVSTADRTYQGYFVGTEAVVDGRLSGYATFTQDWGYDERVDALKFGGSVRVWKGLSARSGISNPYGDTPSVLTYGFSARSDRLVFTTDVGKSDGRVLVLSYLGVSF